MPLRSTSGTPCNSGMSGQICDTGGLLGKMIEPGSPLVKVVSQRQARDRLQGPDDFLCWDLIIPAEYLNQSVCAQNVSSPTHLTNCLNPLQLIRSVILNNGDHPLQKGIADVRWRRLMGADPTTRDPRSPSFEQHVEPVTEMALEDLLYGRFPGWFPEKSSKSFQSVPLGAEKPHDRTRLVDQLHVSAELVEVLPIPYQRDDGPGLDVEEVSAPERRSSGQGSEHLPIEPGKFPLVPATGDDMGKPCLKPERRRALLVGIQDEITQQ